MIWYIYIFKDKLTLIKGYLIGAIFIVLFGIIFNIIKSNKYTIFFYIVYLKICYIKNSIIDVAGAAACLIVEFITLIIFLQKNKNNYQLIWW